MSKLRQSLLLLVLSFPILMSCHKSAQNTIFEQFFEDNVLDRTFIITYANNKGTDLTSQYSGYTFILSKGSDFFNGPMKATKDGTIYSGTWSSNEDYSKLNIVLPATPSEFVFLNRNWRFASKRLPTLKFTPWGSTEDIQLTMERQ